MVTGQTLVAEQAVDEHQVSEAVSAKVKPMTNRSMQAPVVSKRETGNVSNPFGKNKCHH